LEELEVVGYYLGIGYNTSLTNIRALGGVSRVGSGLYVYDNPVLPTCEAEWLLDTIGTNNVGYWYIYRNDDFGVCP
jgi:hypothetical protein